MNGEGRKRERRGIGGESRKLMDGEGRIGKKEREEGRKRKREQWKG